MNQKRTTKKSKRLYLVIVSCAITLVIASSVLLAIFWTNNLPVTLDLQYYGDTEVIDIGKTDYETMLKDKKSFVVMVDNAGCTTTAKMRDMMKDLPEKFTYYRILWPEAKDTDLASYVKYFPSIVVVEKGKVKYYLRADSDEDVKYYNDSAALESWLKSKINF